MSFPKYKGNDIVASSIIMNSLTLYAIYIICINVNAKSGFIFCCRSRSSITWAICNYDIISLSADVQLEIVLS
jgi:hypothetical protein